MGPIFTHLVAPLGGGADAGNKDAPQQEIRYAEDWKRHLFEKAVIDDGHSDHREDSGATPHTSCFLMK